MRKAFAAVLLAAAVTATAEPPDAPPTRPRSQPPSPDAVLKMLGGGHRPCVERRTGGAIDWTRGQILADGEAKVRGASGQAVAMARRAARLVAARNAVLLISGLRVDADGAYPDIRSGQISVEAVLKDCQEAAFEYDPMGRTVRVTLRVPFYGVRGVVKLTGVAATPQADAWDWPKERQDGGTADIVVVDARKTKFQPVLFPRLETVHGKKVFDAGDDPEGEQHARALAVYATKMAPPAQPATQPDSRPAARLLVLTASTSKGNSNGAAVLGDSELAELAARPEARRCMADGRLVILTSEPR